MQCSLGQVVPITWQNETTWSSSSMCFFLNKKKKKQVIFMQFCERLCHIASEEMIVLAGI